MKTATLGIIHNDLEFVKKELKEIKIPHLSNKKKKNRVNPYLEKGLQKSGLTEEKADELAALFKNPVIYHRGERRDHRVLIRFQSLLRFYGASAFSVCSAVNFKDLAISL